MKFIYLSLILLIATIVSAQDINQVDANGERQGVWRKNFDKTKVLRYEGEFSHGKEIGLFKFYKNINGKAVLTATRQFNESNNIAEVKFYSSTGKIISEGNMNGKIYVGAWKYYQKRNNQLLTLENYNDNGLLDGERLIYYANGQVSQKEFYTGGKLTGISTWYSEEGVPIKEFTYVNDELHGLSKYYDGKGDLIVEGNYKRGKKEKIWKYYENGKLVEEKNFTREPKFKKNP